MGISVRFLEYLLLFLIGITVVILIRSVGIMMCLSMLVAPAGTAKLLFNKLSTRIAGAVAFGFIFNLVGLIISYIFDLPSGGVIVTISVITYFLVYFLTGKFFRRKRHEANI